MADRNPFLPGDLPQDMRDLMIRLDERVKNGFESTNKQFEQINTKLDAHEKSAKELDTRVHKLEIDKAERDVLKTTFQEQTLPTVEAHERRLTAIEERGKSNNGFLDLTIKVLPSVITLVLAIGSIFWTSKNHAEQMAQLQRDVRSAHAAPHPVASTPPHE